MTKEAYRYLLATYGRQPGFWFGIFAEVVRTGLLIVLGGWLVSVMVQHLLAHNIDATIHDVWLWMVAGIGALLFSFIGEMAALRAEGAAYHALQLTFYKKLAGKDMAFYRDSQTGYLVSVYRQHCDGLMELSRFVRSDIARAVTVLLVPIIILWWFDWRVGIIGVGLVIVQVIYVVWSSAKVNPYREITHEIYRKLSGEVADQITNMVAFKASGQEIAGEQQVQMLAEKENDAFWKRRSLAAWLDLPRMVITIIGMGAALLVILYEAKGAVDIGFFVLVFIYIFRILQEVYGFPDRIMRHDDLITKIAPTLPYLEVSDYEMIRDPRAAKQLMVERGVLELKNVGFSYKNKSGKAKKTEIFSNLSLTINGKEHVGIVGLSGAGKSTLAGLIMRFDDVDQGAITIDDVDIREIRQSDLRQNIAYVPQEPLLFHKTIRENIAYFNNTATNEEIERAAKAAHAHEFIAKLAEGYDTIVGERGVKLSGGQKQRIAIARAILKNAPIILLDEATSALDSESERIIQSSLPQVLGEHTAIVIAHRLSTIAGLDRIIVMQGGKIIEQGTHQELLKLGGRYKALWDKQVQFYG